MSLVLAVLAAVGYGLASVLQAVGARGGGGALRTVVAPAYAAGVLLDLLAWLASLAALRALPVYEVQAVLAGSLAVTTVGARIFLARRLRRVDSVAVDVTVAALAVLAFGAGPQHPVRLGAAATWSVAALVLPLALLGWRAGRAARASSAAVLAGLAFGGASLCARAVELPAGLRADPLSAALTVAREPLAWSLAMFGVIGTLLYAVALEHGDVGRGTALLWTTEVAVPSVAGLLLLHDSIRAGWSPFVVAALAAAIAAAAVLAETPPLPLLPRPPQPPNPPQDHALKVVLPQFPG